MKKYLILLCLIFNQTYNSNSYIQQLALVPFMHKHSSTIDEKSTPSTNYLDEEIDNADNEDQFSNFYQTLNIPMHSSINQINKKFKSTSRTKHPDKYSNSSDNEKYTELSGIKSSLEDPEKRFEFDVNLIENEISFIEEKIKKLKKSLEDAYVESYTNGYGSKILNYFDNISLKEFKDQKTDNAVNLKRNIETYDEKVIEINKKIKTNENKIKELKEKIEYFLSNKKYQDTIDGLLGSRFRPYKIGNPLILYTKGKDTYPAENSYDNFNLNLD